jgi:hypothetical protein
MTRSLPPLPQEGALRTNPVYVLQAVAKTAPEVLPELPAYFAEVGAHLSPAAQRFLGERRLGPAPLPEITAATPGVVGLVYQEQLGSGFVSPLAARLAVDWDVAPNLPFQAPRLRLLLTQLLKAAGSDMANFQEDLFAFDVRDLAGFGPEGGPMTIAGLLAVLVAAAGDPTGLFRAACAVVEPGDGGTLRSIGKEWLPEKLDAFVREYERGSLLVRPRRCPEADPFNKHFERVWLVSSLADLAQESERAGLLAPFRMEAPLDHFRFDLLRDRLRHMAAAQHLYQRVLRLAEHLLQCPRGLDVPLSSAGDVRQLIYDLQRHLGLYKDAIIWAGSEVRRLEHDKGPPSFDEQARVAAALAGALYDAHRFHDARRAIGPKYKRLRAEPDLASPQTRVQVFTVLAEVEAILGGDYVKKFRAAAVLQKTFHPPQRAWTYCLWAHALLRQERRQAADRVLRWARICPGASMESRWMIGFLHADLARRRNKSWTDPKMEGQLPMPGPTGRLFGMYFQATARQPGRSSGDRIERLHRAIAFFEMDGAGLEGPTLPRFLATCLRLRIAAETGDVAAWRPLRRELYQYLRGINHRGLSRHYRAGWEALGPDPAIGPAEAFLSLVPLF